MAANKELIELHDDLELYVKLNNDSDELEDIKLFHSLSKSGLIQNISQIKLSLMHELLRLAERASFQVNLDYFRWLISYGWNLGIQKYKMIGQSSEKDDARLLIQFCYTLVQQLQLEKKR
jgi:hypothetical protein